MKRIRLLLPIILIVMMLASFYKLTNDMGAAAAEYKKTLETARAFRENGSVKYAEENYTKALEMYPNAELFFEVTQFYKETSPEKRYVECCNEFKAIFPEEPRPYELLLDCYNERGNYLSCFRIIKEAKARGVESQRINEIYIQIWDSYAVVTPGFTDVGLYSDGYCNVKTNELWGTVNMAGETGIPAAFESIGGFSLHNSMAIVKKPQGDFIFVDYAGAKVKPAPEGYEAFGVYSEGFVPAMKNNGKYVYLGSGSSEQSSEFDYASTMMNNVAAVRINDTWSIIDHNMNTIGSGYSEILVDENNIASRSERIFARINDSVFMLDISGNQVSNTAFEDARPFGDDDTAAVKLNGKWGFADTSGNIVIEPTYEDARSFSNGMAAVCVNSTWGFIDKTGEMVIKPAFDGAKDFNSAGGCFVLEGEYWRLLRLYRYMV